MTTRMNYKTLKRLAKERGQRVTDLIALARQNDPFYVGTPRDRAAGRWFAELWRRFDYATGVHLRRVHYQVISQDPPVIKPNGTPYVNTDNDWKYLCEASKVARYLELVDPAAFVDRRNPNPIIHADYWMWQDPTPRYELEAQSGFDVHLPEFPTLPTFKVRGYEGNFQPYHVEVWCEKTTQNDILGPVCSRYGVNLITGAGELSITSVLDLVSRVKQANRPCRIFYVSDFDPAGYGMPVSVARKIEFFVGERALDIDIRLEPIALTKAQVVDYRLPRTPIKESELRKGAFEDAHGEGAVELDALEALYPGTLAEIVGNAILTYHDPDVEDEAQKQKDALSAALEEARAEILADLTPEIETLKAEFAEMVADFEVRAKRLHERIGPLFDEVLERLEAVDVDLASFPLPEGKEAEEPDGVLYDSARDYMTQLAYYKARKSSGR